MGKIQRTAKNSVEDPKLLEHKTKTKQSPATNTQNKATMSQSAAARALLLGDGSKPPKLEYFAIEGAAEPVRIALSIAGVAFEDATFPL